MVDEVYDAAYEEGDITKVVILIRNASLQALQITLLVAEFPADASARNRRGIEAFTPVSFGVPLAPVEDGKILRSTVVSADGIAGSPRRLIHHLLRLLGVSGLNGCHVLGILLGSNRSLEGVVRFFSSGKFVFLQ